MKPFRVKPLPVVRLWGGRRLAEWRQFPPATEPIGESWEVFGELHLEHEDCTLDELCRRHGRQLLGSAAPDPQAGFPLLIKWLDCQQWLSVQVHPDDAVAGRGQRGKAEAWYFAEVAPEAEVIHGWKQDVPTRQQLERLKPGEWMSYLRRYRPQAGSWSYTAPGTVHALGPGLLVYEVQQSSDLTYRLYDWDRVGLDGRPRETHVAQAIEAICESLPEKIPDPPGDLLGKLEIICPHFTVESVGGDRSWSTGGASFELLTALQPLRVDCQGESWQIEEGGSLIVPADAGALRCSSEGHWLRVRLAPA